MFENLKRSATAINRIIKSRRDHKAKMKMIREDGDWMLNEIDKAFENLKK
jgi:hypothetical protein